MSQTTETVYRYRWVILGVLWTTYVVVYLQRLSVGPLAPFFKEELGVSSAQVGLVMSAAGLGYMITQLPVGWVVDRIGARWPMAVGELIAGISMMALFFVPSYIWLLILMFAAGMGCGFLMPSTTQGVIMWFPTKERATVMGFKQTAVNVGGIITAATLPTVALILGWRYGFLFLGITAIIIGFAALVLYKEPPGTASVGATGAVSPVRAVPFLEILKNREIWLLATCGLFFSWVEFAMIAHLVLYLTEALPFSVVAAGGLLAMVEAVGVVARPGGGVLSDRVFGGKRKPVLVSMAAISSAACLILGLFGTCLSWVIYPVLFLLGLGGIAFGGVFLALVAEFGGRHGAGKATGLSTTVVIVGTIVGPVAFGHIVDISNSYTWAWLSLAVVAALCALLLFLVREEKRKI